MNQPAPPVRLTDKDLDELLEEWPEFNWMKPFAHAIMDAMEKINQGESK